MNSELIQKALEKIGNSHVLVNMVSRRVRELNASGGRMSRPLIVPTENLGVADTALREIIEGRIGFEMPELIALTRPSGQKRRRPQGWMNSHAAT